jgi:hypothetical protein
MGGDYFEDAPFRDPNYLEQFFKKYESCELITLEYICYNDHSSSYSNMDQEPEPDYQGYVKSCIRACNNSEDMKDIIISAVSPLAFLKIYPYNNNTYEFSHENAVKYLNEGLIYDNYEIQQKGRQYTVVELDEDDIPLECKGLSDEFVKKQINICRQRISVGEFDGAITNARSIVEKTLQNVAKALNVNDNHCKGNLMELHQAVGEALGFRPKDKTNQDIMQTLSGLTSIIQGMSALCNSMGDRHAPKLKAHKRHAKLVINSAITYTNFILSTFEYNKTKSSENSKTKTPKK